MRHHSEKGEHGVFRALRAFFFSLFHAIEGTVKGMRALVKNPILRVLSGIILVIGLISAGIAVLWLATLKIPDINSFQTNYLAVSTKIYDKTGEVLLFNVNQDVKRTVVPFDQISPFLKKATVAIEDESFYTHHGIKITSIIRAVLVDIFTGSFNQGGSTITQQVIKNSLLTTEKKISRKIKEWVLALKLERVMDKDSILNLYLNGTPYGGPMYGVEEASQAYFGKPARDVTLAEAAYIAAMAQAPTHYSPYGNYTHELESRKNLVLKRMLDNKLITSEEYKAGLDERVVFSKPGNQSIKAPHFVSYVKEYLTEKYGEDAVNTGGLKVTTSLDYSLQERAEDIVNTFALENEKKFSASNAGLVAVDPKTGGILVMVGSRNYFDPNIEGNFNITTAHRQPGSSFKPFVYAAAFNKGYTPDTILFDVETEFSTSCNVDPIQNLNNPNCYSPGNYDDLYRGPITIRNALAQSINIPAVKALYLVGVNNAIDLAHDMGIQGLKEKDRYGLTLVLGGGEVSLLDMASAYSVFANNGIRNEYVSVLKVEDPSGKVLEEYKPHPIQVLPEETALNISSILSDNVARAPSFGTNSFLHFPNSDVAVKTGTTNDYRDAWILGYTPSISVGAWAGNNNNSAMQKKVAGMIVAPMWRAFMDEVLKTAPQEEFKSPPPVDQSLKPILRGIWQTGSAYSIDSVTGLPATTNTPTGQVQQYSVPQVHDILYYVNKNDPLGPPPGNPYADPQYQYWEYGVQKWLISNSTQNSIQPSPVNNATSTVPVSN